MFDQPVLSSALSSVPYVAPAWPAFELAFTLVSYLKKRRPCSSATSETKPTFVGS